MGTEDDRGAAIDQLRIDLLDQTSLYFLPRRHEAFLADYYDLPGKQGMSIRDRIKLISDDYRRKFLRRVETVVQHSRQADLDRVSEFNWEADAWRDIFGRLRDDERLRMDKREYNFKATTLDSLSDNTDEVACMGKRIPDITFGLSSYHSGDPDDEGVDERERRIRRSLQTSRLGCSIWTFDGNSLVADPKWGKYTLLFPFAVYEAKRDQQSEITVRVQLKLAFNTYLQMLDQLVRQPGNVEEYQSSQSRIFPIFGFTSSGSRWNVYVGYLPNCAETSLDTADGPLCDEDSYMKLIWWGETTNRQHAGELLDIVDQIHEYAVTTHRLFVASHLEVWERFTEQNVYQRMASGELAGPLPEQDVKRDWYWIKSKGTKVQRMLRYKHQKGIPRTDDDERKAALEARLKQYEKARKTRKTQGRPRKEQPLRRSPRNLRNSPI